VPLRIKTVVKLLHQRPQPSPRFFDTTDTLCPARVTRPPAFSQVVHPAELWAAAADRFELLRGGRSWPQRDAKTLFAGGRQTSARAGRLRTGDEVDRALAPSLLTSEARAAPEEKWSLPRPSILPPPAGAITVFLDLSPVFERRLISLSLPGEPPPPKTVNVTRYGGQGPPPEAP